MNGFCVEVVEFHECFNGGVELVSDFPEGITILDGVGGVF